MKTYNMVYMDSDGDEYIGPLCKEEKCAYANVPIFGGDLVVGMEIGDTEHGDGTVVYYSEHLTQLAFRLEKNKDA